MKRWTQYLTWQFVERVLGDAECLSRILRGEYRPSMAALIGFYAATLLGSADPVNGFRRAYGRDL